MEGGEGWVGMGVYAGRIQLDVSLEGDDLLAAFNPTVDPHDCLVRRELIYATDVLLHNKS